MIAPETPDEELLAVAALLRERTGLVFDGARWPQFARAAHRLLSGRKGRDWRARLDAEPALLERLLADITIPETYFFRDQRQFSLITDRILPDLLADGGPLRLWSAAAATGEEPYSLAILLDQLGQRDAFVLGTDLCRAWLARARRARFRAWSLRATPPPIRQRYFRRRGDHFILAEPLRRAVEFRQVNLADPAGWPANLDRMDLVLCRNVLIYLDAEAIARVARRLLDCLSPRGWLLVGAADPPLGEYVTCQVQVTEAGLAYRRAATARGARRAPAPPPSPGVRAAPITRPAGGDPPPVRQAATPPRDRVGAIRVQLDAGRLEEAEQDCLSGLARHPDSAELSGLYALILGQRRQARAAALAARRSLYLDRHLVVGHLALAEALRQLGEAAGAARALESAERELAGYPPTGGVPAAGDVSVANLLALIRTQRGQLTGDAAP